MIWQPALTRPPQLPDDLTLFGLADVCRTLNDHLTRWGWGDRFAGVSGDDRARAVWRLAVALGERLAQAGGAPLNRPGRPMAVELRGEVVELQPLIWQLVEGAVSAEAWRRWCADRQLADLPLNPAVHLVES